MSYTEKGPRLNILNNTLVIKENNVELVTDFNYRIIDIRFSKNLSIESKLPSDYLFRKTTNRLLIIKVNNRDEIMAACPECVDDPFLLTNHFLDNYLKPSVD